MCQTTFALSLHIKIAGKTVSNIAVCKNCSLYNFFDKNSYDDEDNRWFRFKAQVQYKRDVYH